jgi:shikimate dehydrogenase
MRSFGLIGYPLSHSFSPAWFENYFKTKQITDAHYSLFPLPTLNDFFPLLSTVSNLKGLNVTLPYKQEIIPYLHALTQEAMAVGAVNCIKIKEENGSHYLTGHNTDCEGFKNSFIPHLTTQPSHCLVFGNGGASKAVQYTLDQLGMHYTVVSRQGPFTYEMLSDEIAKEAKIWIQTAPIGMFPSINECLALPYHTLSPQHLVFDLVYNPTVTQFMQHGIRHGAKAVNGLDMLYSQAEAAALFFGL